MKRQQPRAAWLAGGILRVSAFDCTDATAGVAPPCAKEARTAMFPALLLGAALSLGQTGTSQPTTFGSANFISNYVARYTDFSDAPIGKVAFFAEPEKIAPPPDLAAPGKAEL